MAPRCIPTPNTPSAFKAQRDCLSCLPILWQGLSYAGPCWNRPHRPKDENQFMVPENWLPHFGKDLSPSFLVKLALRRFFQIHTLPRPLALLASSISLSSLSVIDCGATPTMLVCGWRQPEHKIVLHQFVLYRNQVGIRKHQRFGSMETGLDFVPVPCVFNLIHFRSNAACALGVFAISLLETSSFKVNHISMSCPSSILWFVVGWAAVVKAGVPVKNLLS